MNITWEKMIQKDEIRKNSRENVMQRMMGILLIMQYNHECNSTNDAWCG